MTARSHSRTRRKAARRRRIELARRGIRRTEEAEPEPEHIDPPTKDEK